MMNIEDESIRCERYHCTWKRKFCIARMKAQGTNRHSFDTWCLVCEEGKKSAQLLGVKIPKKPEPKRNKARVLIDEL